MKINEIINEAAPAGVRLAAGAATGAVAGLGGHIMSMSLPIIGPILAPLVAAYSAKSGYDVGAGAADGLWDLVANNWAKIKGEITELPKEQQVKAMDELKQVKAKATGN